MILKVDIVMTDILKKNSTIDLRNAGGRGEGREGKACILPNFNKSEESKDLGENKSLIAYI